MDIDAVTEVLARHPGIGLAYVFGSVGRGVAWRGGAGRKGRRVRGGDTAHARLLDDRSCAWIG